MAFLDMTFFSESLGMQSSAYVVIPQTTTAQIGMKGTGTPDGCPVLYLLHGMSDDHTIWLRRTSVERYAGQHGIAIVMPNAHRSYYNDMPSGLNYWSFVSRELPSIVGSFFKFSQRREDTYVAGLSMGGFGAMKLAFNCPDRFAAAASFSGALSPDHLRRVMASRNPEFDAIFGDLDAIPGSVNDLYAKAEFAASENTDLPELFLSCGTEDFLYQENLRFKKHLETCGVPFEYYECPGNHEWGLWDRNIQMFLEKIARLRKKEQAKS